ncbi:MAG TPA: hemolysin family protein [Acidimicrobiales bacterium]|nr:hemolysin family protein [Acidimicrobiales bacterium]
MPPEQTHRATRRRWPFGRHQDHGTGRARDARHSAASEQERLIVARLADLRDMDVREVMTPRVDVVALTIPVTADAVAQAVRESGHSCFPVVHDDLDDLVGVLFVNDLFRAGRRPGPGESSEPTPLDISRRLRQPYIAPESRRILDVLSEMRQQRRAFAVVVDEHGGVAGVLTVKDLLEPLVGDLYDEFDPEEEPEIVRVDANRWLIDGRTSVDDVRERLDIEVPDGEYVTLGGFLFERFGHIPVEGESLPAGDWELRVAEMDKRRIAKVVARRRSSEPASGKEAGAEGAPGQAERDRPPSRATTGP